MYSYDYNYDYAPGLASGIVSAILAVIAVYWVIFIALYALEAIPKWKLYEKAGQPGWAALVPFYKDYVIFEIAWGNGIMFLLLLIPGANLVIWIITWIKLAKAFGKDGGWACGLIFLNLIFLYIMAFSDDIVYIGVPDDRSRYNAGYGQPGYGPQGYGQPGYGPQGYQNPYSQTYGSQQSPNAAKYCTSCGAPLEDGARFCSGCGKPQ